MRKALVPLVASLALCGAATAALVATNARAEQNPKKPVMVALASAPSLGPDTAAPVPLDVVEAAPADMMGGAPDMMPGARFCQDLYARKVGGLAFLEAKLALTPAQQPLFARWKTVTLDIARKHEGDCTAMIKDRRDARAKDEPRDLIGGLALEEKMLKLRLADIQAERPALEALYGALNPAQKDELAGMARRGMGGRLRIMAGMMGHGGGMHPMGPMDHMQPGAMPPPPPPQ